MTWTRKGECNNCGWCCQFFGQDVASFRLGPEADVEFFKAREFTMFIDRPGGPAVAATKLCSSYAPCPQHENNQCKIYATRPITCVEFPVMPEQIRYTPCSYWFEDEWGKKIGGQGSPHPVLIPAFNPGGNK